MSKIGGKIVFAGQLQVAGQERFGFFLECSGPDVMEIQRAGLLNQPVTVHPAERRSHKRALGPAFRRLPPVETFPAEIRAI